MILLIHPPVSKPSEPPAGIARLSGMLKESGVAHHVFDASLEGLLFLLEKNASSSAKADSWTRRALKNPQKNLSALRDPGLYRSLDRYGRAVADLSRALGVAGGADGIQAGLANYQDRVLSPLRSGDLLASAEQPERNIFYPQFSMRLRELITLHSPLYAGFSINFLNQAVTAFAMIGFLRKEYPGLKIVAGGGLITSWIRGTQWNNPFGGLVDDWIAGPGEGPLSELLGISARQGFPKPCFDFGLRRDYLSPGFVLPYSTASGCYWSKCTFCPEKAESSGYSSHPPQAVIAELQELVKSTDPVLIHLADSGLSPAMLEALVKDPPGRPWYGFTRIGPLLADHDFCAALAQSGCVMLKIGLESGDQGVLDWMNKGIELGTASAVLKALRKAGIRTYVYLLFGTPAETRKEAENTRRFVMDHYTCIDYLNLAVYNMPSASAAESGFETKQFYEGDLSLYCDFVHPRGWSRRAVREYLETEFRKEAAISRILRRDPPVFTSNHAPFFSDRFRSG